MSNEFSRASRVIVRGVLVVSVVSAWAGCGGDDDAVDAGDAATTDVTTDVASGPCRGHDDCDDRRFCNGVERCDPDSPSADERGCAPGVPPCPPDRCDEADRSCDETCPDADGDGYEDARCGGDDCDDTNPAINPGATEVCDPDHVDEDCNPLTFAGPEGDRDEDGFISNQCCNYQPDGSLACGNDCNDDDPLINPAAMELCDGVDNNCNGSVDEGCPCTPEGLEEVCDDEFDGIGNCRAGTRVCTADGWTSCAGSVTPTEEICNTLLEDENCNGVVDEGCDCLSPLTRSCSTDIGRCVAREQVCGPNGQWPRDCADEPGVVFPRTEMCNGVDDDCDGIVDNGCDCSHGASRSCGTSVGRCTIGTQMCASGAWTTCTGTPPRAESCNRLDDNCNGRIDEGVATAHCQFTASASAGRTAFLACDPNCSPFSPSTVIRRLGSVGDTTPRALWLHSRDMPVDWGSSAFTALGTFRAHHVSGAGTQARAAVMISPQTGLGSASRNHLPPVPPGRVGFAAEVLINQFQNQVRLFRITSSAATEVGTMQGISEAPCVTSRGGELRYQITLRASNGGQLRATLRVFGLPGCDFTRHVDYTETNWINTMYGSATNDLRYEVGVLVNGLDTNGNHDLETLTVTRWRTSGERGFCQPCPWRL